MLSGRQWVSVLLTIRWRRAALELCQNFNVTTDPQVCSCSSSRTACFHPPPRWGCWRRHMMPHTKQPVDRVLVPSPCIPGCSPRSVPVPSPEGAPLGLSPFSRHRSLKKHLTASLASSRTSASRADAGPRVCPFCPDVAVPPPVSVTLNKSCGCRHITVSPKDIRLTVCFFGFTGE